MMQKCYEQLAMEGFNTTTPIGTRVLVVRKEFRRAAVSPKLGGPQNSAVFQHRPDHTASIAYLDDDRVAKVCLQEEGEDIPLRYVVRLHPVKQFIDPERVLLVGRRYHSQNGKLIRTPLIRIAARFLLQRGFFPGDELEVVFPRHGELWFRNLQINPPYEGECLRKHRAHVIVTGSGHQAALTKTGDDLPRFGFTTGTEMVRTFPGEGLCRLVVIDAPR